MMHARELKGGEAQSEATQLVWYEVSMEVFEGRQRRTRCPASASHQGWVSSSEGGITRMEKSLV